MTSIASRISSWTGTPADLFDLIRDELGRDGEVRVRESVGWSGARFVEVRVDAGERTDIIDALKLTSVWDAWWDTSHRSGVHEFSVTADQFDVPVTPGRAAAPVSVSARDAALAAAYGENVPVHDGVEFTVSGGQIRVHLINGGQRTSTRGVEARTFFAAVFG